MTWSSIQEPKVPVPKGFCWTLAGVVGSCTTVFAAPNIPVENSSDRLLKLVAKAPDGRRITIELNKGQKIKHIQ